MSQINPEIFNLLTFCIFSILINIFDSLDNGKFISDHNVTVGVNEL